MSKGRYPYPPDEFDEIAQATAAHGLHREPRSAWSRVWPFLAVLVIFPALAYGVVTVLSGWEGVTPSPTGQSQAATPSETPPEDPEQSQEPTEEPTPEPVLTTPVRVLNSTTVSGLAASGATMVEAAGFTDVVAANFSGTAPATSVVYYGSEDLSATALAVGAAVGIGQVELSADQAPDGVVVVLTGDFQP